MDKAVKRIIVSLIYVFISSVVIFTLLIGFGADFQIVFSDESRARYENDFGEVWADKVIEEENEGMAKACEMFDLENASFVKTLSGIWNSAQQFVDEYWETVGSSNLGYTLFSGFLGVFCWISVISLAFWVLWVFAVLILSLVGAIAVGVGAKTGKLTKTDKIEKDHFDAFSHADILWRAPLFSLISVWILELLYNIMMCYQQGWSIFNMQRYAKVIPTTGFNHLVILVAGILLFCVGRAVINKIYGKPTKKEKTQEAQSAEK